MKKNQRFITLLVIFLVVTAVTFVGCDFTGKNSIENNDQTLSSQGINQPGNVQIQPMGLDAVLPVKIRASSEYAEIKEKLDAKNKYIDWSTFQLISREGEGGPKILSALIRQKDDGDNYQQIEEAEWLFIHLTEPPEQERNSVMGEQITNLKDYKVNYDNWFSITVIPQNESQSENNADGLSQKKQKGDLGFILISDIIQDRQVLHHYGYNDGKLERRVIRSKNSVISNETISSANCDPTFSFTVCFDLAWEQITEDSPDLLDWLFSGACSSCVYSRGAQLFSCMMCAPLASVVAALSGVCLLSPETVIGPERCRNESSGGGGSGGSGGGYQCLDLHNSSGYVKTCCGYSLEQIVSCAQAD